MNTILFLSFVIVCLFISKIESKESESKEFCQMFKENDFKIDYGFEYRDKEQIHMLFVIGKHYWFVTHHKYEVMLNTQSFLSEFLGNQYLTGFSHRASSLDSYVYGFIKKNTLITEWMDLEMKESVDLILIKFITNSNQLDYKGFLPTVSVLGQKGDTNVHILISQTPKTKDEELFKRQSMSFSVDVKDDFKHFINYYNSDTVYRSQLGYRDLIIAIEGPLTSPNKREEYLIFFLKNKTIEYCFMDKPNDMFLIVDQTCTTQRKSLIECLVPRTQSKDSYDIMAIIFKICALIVIILIIVAIIVFIWMKYLRFSRKKRIGIKKTYTKPKSKLNTTEKLSENVSESKSETTVETKRSQPPPVIQLQSEKTKN